MIIGSVAIRGGGAEATIIERADYLIPAPPRFRIFEVAATGSLMLDDVTVRGGNPGTGGVVGNGGAIFSRGTVSITDTVIRNNRAGFAGAIQIVEGEFTLSDSRITNNGSGSPETGGILSIGERQFGGPGPFGGSSATIARSSVSNNALFSGAAIRIRNDAIVTIMDSDISRNQPAGLSTGAGISAGGGSGSLRPVVTIANSTIASNFLLGFGFRPGISSGNADMLITNSTITNNSSGGVLGSPRIQNSIVAGNNPNNVGSEAFGDCRGGLMSLGHNLFGNPVGCGTLMPSDLVGDAGLGGFIDAGRPGGGYLPLLPGSRAIDAGDAGACSPTEQLGLTRPIDGNGDGFRACDIGAVEFYPVINDLVQLERAQTTETPPSLVPRLVNPLATGGEFWITTVFSNREGVDICHVAFEVLTLESTAGASPLS